MLKANYRSNSVEVRLVAGHVFSDCCSSSFICNFHLKPSPSDRALPSTPKSKRGPVGKATVIPAMAKPEGPKSMRRKKAARIAGKPPGTRFIILLRITIGVFQREAFDNPSWPSSRKEYDKTIAFRALSIFSLSPGANPSNLS